MEGKSVPPAMSPNPGSVPLPGVSPVPAGLSMPDSAPAPVPVLRSPPEPEAPPLGMPLPGLPDDDGLDPLLPPLLEALELLDPEPPLLELGELGPLDPPALGDEAPELEGEEGGEGTDGVVGVLAEGQPINSSMAVMMPPTRNGRTTDILRGVRGVIGVAVPLHRNWTNSNQRTTQSYQYQRPLRPRSGA